MKWLHGLLRPWKRHPWQSLFHWLALAAALGLTGLLAQIRIHGHLDLPPGIMPQLGYYSLGAKDTRGHLSPLALLQTQQLLRELKPTLGQYSLYAETNLELHIGQRPAQYYKVALMNHAFYELLGIKPAQGHLFSHNREQAAQEALISHRFWESLNRPSPAQLSIRLQNTREWTVAGVLPPGFDGFGVHPVDIWLPDTLLPEGLLKLNLAPEMPPEIGDLTLRFAKRMPYFHILGIQTDTLRRSQMEQTLKTLDLRMPPLTTAGGPVITGGLVQNHQAMLAFGLNLAPELWRKTRHYTRLLQVVSFSLMALTLISLAVFLLEQLPERMDEFRLRYIHGASMSALARQIFSETLPFVITTLPLAWSISRLLFIPLARMAPFDQFVPGRLPPPGPDLFSWGIPVALVLAGLLSLIPLWPLRHRLLPGSTATTTGRRENQLLLALNALQNLAAIVALVVTGLFLANLVRYSNPWNQDAGQVQMLTLQCAANAENCDVTTLLTLDEQLLLSRLNAPTDQAGLGETLFNPLLGQKDLQLHPMMKTASGAGRIDLAAAYVSNGWLRAMGVSLIAGRWPALEGDVLVNEAFLLNQGLTASQAIGRQYQRNGSSHVAYTITGILADLSLEDPRKPPLPRLFFTIPSHIAMRPRNEIVWRDAAEPGRLKQRLDKALKELGMENLTVHQESLAQRIARRLQGERNFAWLLAWSVVFSLLLALLGLYASTRHALDRQQARLGIFLAYGAAPRQAAGFLYRERGLVLILAIFLALFVLGLLQPLLNPWLLTARTQLPVLLLATLLGILLAAGLAVGLALRRLWHSQPMELIRDQA